MVKQSPKTPTQTAHQQPKIIADYGGRRKLLDRRLKSITIAHKDRRTGNERRSGFDRRSTLTQSDEKSTAKSERLDRRNTSPGNR